MFMRAACYDFSWRDEWLYAPHNICHGVLLPFCYTTHHWTELEDARFVPANRYTFSVTFDGIEETHMALTRYTHFCLFHLVGTIYGCIAQHSIEMEGVRFVPAGRHTFSVASDGFEVTYVALTHYTFLPVSPRWYNLSGAGCEALTSGGLRAPDESPDVILLHRRNRLYLLVTELTRYTSCK